MQRESSVRKLAVVYLLVGSGLFLYSMYHVVRVYGNAYNSLDPDGQPLQRARVIKIAEPVAPKPTRYVPPAIPVVPIY